MVVCGIDVSKGTLEVVVAKQNRLLKVRTFSNSPEGHQSLLSYLKKQSVKRICLEATGNYHLDLALTLHADEQVELMVVNPRATHHFAKAMMEQNKTDAIDARLLAQFALQMPFAAWRAPEKTVLDLRACSRWMVNLSQSITQNKNRLHAMKSTRQTPPFLLEQVETHVEQLEQQLDDILKYANTLIQASSTLQRLHELLLSVKGIADRTAIKLLGELCVLPEDMTAKQWVAHAALFPRIIQSGKTINKKPRIGKSGNRHIREALYMPALNAAYRHPNISAFYQHLIQDNGLSKLQALCAVMRKLLVCIHAMFKTNRPFDGEKFYVAR